MLTLIVDESTEVDATIGKRFQEIESGFMASPVTDMDTVTFQRRTEGFL